MLELRGATYRHPIRRPTRLRPWARAPGPGIRGIDLSIEGGIILGLVGPNGAGKTTLLQVLASLLPLESGRVILRDAQTDLQRRAAIGYMPERVTWAGPGTPRQVMARLCAMRGLDSEGARMLELVGLTKRSNDDLSTLSQGMKQRLSLAATLLGEPRVLLLDEPLNGLDPVAQGAFRNLLRQLADRGVAVIVSSHSLADLERLADEVVLMHRGRIVSSGPLTEIERGLGLRARLDVAGLGEMPDDFGEEVEVESIAVLQGEDWAARLHLNEGEWTAERRAALHSGLQVTRLSPVPAELEAVISAATGMAIEDAGFTIFSDSEVSEDD
jgi:ABC-2 type transport system ATP-binding protein